jgi:DNA polymerase-3 subunit gamma/tau
LQVILRTFDELNYRQEPRLHLELGLMKLVHLQRLLPLEQILSGLPGAGATRTNVTRPASAMPAQATRPAPPPISLDPPKLDPPKLDPPKPKPIAPSPFDLDSQRKQAFEEETEVVRTPVPVVQPSPVQEPVPVAVAPEPPPVRVAETNATATDLGPLREAVTAALDEQGHNTAASLLGAGRWKLDEDGAIQVEVGVKKTMLGLTMNGEAWKIVREALRTAGGTQKMTVVPGESSEPAGGSPRVFSRDSIEAVALGNPLVRQAQEMFHAEVRSVLDLRDKGKG